jgi:hypothetical protein
MILDVQTIPNGFILRGEEMLFSTMQLPNYYIIISPIDFMVDTTNGIINFVTTDMSCDGVQYNTPQEFITALGL